MTEIERLFAPDGALARAVPGYRSRPQQIEMAHQVEEVIRGSGVLIAEAGTGTGKTFAYLAPALLHGGKVIISTATKTLQDQLFHRDVPTLRAALRIPVTLALLKGRANYVCHHHLERALGSGRFNSREDVRDLHAIARFARHSQSGDRGECDRVAEDAAAWNYATSTRENCLGQECAHYEECFVMRARRAAQQAEVVIVNHHLFFADLMLRDSGVAELLPASNTVIFDEAHQLPDTASLFFGESVSSAQVAELARDARAETLTVAKDFSALLDALAALEKAGKDLRLALPAEAGRFSLNQIQPRRGFAEALDALEAKLEQATALLAELRERSAGAANCHQRGVEIGARIARWRRAEQTGAQADLIRWLETYTHSVQMNATPVSVAESFRAEVASHARAWVFTSATLSVKGDFSHFQRRVGLEQARTAVWDSPYDYGGQALLYLPENLPEPNSAAHTKAVVETALPIIRAAKGRSFLLFTSLRALREAHTHLRAALEQEQIKYPLLVQGDAPRSELLERFRALGNAVLLGSHSFWEGVDVRGPALSVVMIDKLPFAPPDDPVVAARIERMQQSGGNAFMDYQLPEAVVSLKQGAGRLIRDETDRGVLVICDPRLVSKAYGRRIWQSLPPMRRTRKLEEVEAFLHALSATAPAVTETALS